MTVAAVSNLDSNEYLLICLRISMGQTVPICLINTHFLNRQTLESSRRQKITIGANKDDKRNAIWWSARTTGWVAVIFILLESYAMQLGVPKAVSGQPHRH